MLAYISGADRDKGAWPDLSIRLNVAQAAAGNTTLKKGFG